MATSGDYRNYFKVGKIRYSHTIDPGTGYPVQNDLASVSVVIPESECFKADAWATALMVAGKDKGFELATRFEIPAHFIYIEKGKLKEASTELFNTLYIRSFYQGGFYDPLFFNYTYNNGSYLQVPLY